MQGQHREGLLYIPLNEQGERAGNPFKASLFGKNAGLPALKSHIEICNMKLKDHPNKQKLKAAVTIALQSTADELSFKKQLGEQGINVVIRRNDTGRIYGMTFIDHNSKPYGTAHDYQTNFLPTSLMIIGTITLSPTSKSLTNHKKKNP